MTAAGMNLKNKQSQFTVNMNVYQGEYKVQVSTDGISCIKVLLEFLKFSYNFSLLWGVGGWGLNNGNNYCRVRMCKLSITVTANML